MFSLTDAGSIAISTQGGKARLPSIRSMVEAGLRGWLRVMSVPLSDVLIESILDQAGEVLAVYKTETGMVECNSPAQGVTAIWRN